jgi:predicted DNA-binding protein (MmcQ/YjbR family)
MAHPLMFDDADPARARAGDCARPPRGGREDHARTTHVLHDEGVRVLRRFAARGDDRSPRRSTLPPRPDRCARAAPRPRFFEPAYLWPHGWLALDLDGATDWDEVAELLDASFRATAPRRLSRRSTHARECAAHARTPQ